MRPIHEGELVEYFNERVNGWGRGRAWSMRGAQVLVEPTATGTPVLLARDQVRPIYEKPETSTKGRPLW